MTATNTDRPPRELSAWMRGRMGELVTRVTSMGLDPHHGPTTIVLPLGEPARVGSREDRTCDRCRTYVPTGRALHPVLVHVTPHMVAGGALCRACVDLEGVVA